MISEWRRGSIVLYCLAAQHYFVPRWEKWLPPIVNFLTMMNSLRLGYQKLKAAIDFISTFSTGHGWTHPLQLMIAENKWVAINIFWGLNEIKKCRPVGCRLQAAGLIKTMLHNTRNILRLKMRVGCMLVLFPKPCWSISVPCPATTVILHHSCVAPRLWPCVYYDSV